MSTESSFEVRFLLTSEAQRLLELIKGLHSYEQLNGLEEIPSKDDLVRDLFHKNDKGDIVPHSLGTFSVVAVDLSRSQVDDDSNIVGYLIYTVRFNLMHGRQFYINSFFIEEPYRRHGLGRKLIKFMQSHGELLGIDKFDVPCQKTNIALNFYHSLGAYSVGEEYIMMATSTNF